MEKLPGTDNEMATPLEKLPTDTVSNGGMITALDKVIHILEMANPIVRWLFYLAGALLFLFTVYMFVDVVLRYLFNRPLPNSLDVGIVVLEVLFFLGCAHVQMQKRHMAIDLLTSKLSIHADLVLSTAIYIICFAVTILLIWQGAVYTLESYKYGAAHYSGMLIYPGAALAPLGFFFFGIVLLRDILSKIVEGIRLNFGAISWFLSLIAPLLIVTFIWFWIQPLIQGGNMLLIGSICIFMTLVLAFLGMPLGFVLLLMAIVLMGSASGIYGALMIPGSILHSHATNYNFSVIPLYTILAYFILNSGLGEDAYLAAYKWMGHWRGGLGHTTIVASAAISACEGSSSASIIALGPIAIPEMKKYKYDEGLAAAVVVSGTILGPMIPPSMGFVMFGILTETSIGKLFIASVIPGIILTALYMAQIWISCRINPKLGPAGESASWKERWRVLPLIGPVILMFVLILGGIYTGVFSAMEGGGIGAIIALIIAMAYRRVTWKNFKNAVQESASLSSLMLFVITSGLVYANAIASSGLSQQFITVVVNAGFTTLPFVFILIIVYLIWGFICDAPIIVLLTIPVLAPIARTLGIDMVWFGILITAAISLGGMTPPFAMGIFILKSIMPSVPLGVIYRGILPFCLSTFIYILLLIFFPGLSTWLPSLMR